MSVMISEATRSRFERKMLSRLRGLGRRVRLYLLLDGLAVLSVASLAAILITLLVDHTLKLEWDLRLGQLLSLLAALVLVAWYRLVRPMRLALPAPLLALLVERRHPRLQSRLITAVEFVDPEASGLIEEVERSPALIDAVVRQAEELAADLRFDEGLAHRRAQGRAALAVGCLAAIVVLGVLARPTMALWFQRNVLLRDVDWPQRNKLVVQGLDDGCIRVPRGEDVTTVALVEPGYEAPRQVFIEYEGEGGRRREQMPAETGDVATEPTATQPVDEMQAPAVRFTHTFERVAGSMRCRVLGGDARTDWFPLDVVDRPRISDVTIHVAPPAYTQQDEYPLRAGQTVAEVLKGSGVRFEITTNKPVREAVLIRESGGEEVELGPADGAGPTHWSAGDRVADSAAYYLRMVDEEGLSNISERARPVRLTVRAVVDQPPKVKMNIEGVGEMVTPEAVLPVSADAADVYGLATAALVCEKLGQNGQPMVEPLPEFEPGTKRFQQTTPWVPGKRGLVEGDRVSLHVEAADFDDVSGPNVGKSSASGLRVVSREELLAELGRREQEYRQDFERLVRQQEELYGDVLSVISRLVSPEPSEDAAKQWRQQARRQRDLGGRVNGLRLQFERILGELRVNQLATPAVEERLGGQIVEPMDRLYRSLIPTAGDRLDALGDSDTADAQQAARDAQQETLREMRAILAGMLKWEGFQEAVTLLRDIQAMQKQLNQETEQKIEEEILGTQPSP